ncbi:Serine protease precursor MucD/AlgY associated with sigma factor RpoE [Rubrivivax sp. A210]|uniref:S1 family peptidase n=1 Tax=Rubrivivax sp. A210 TaxID=2772301 RepID=UPI00199EC4B5|nr:serine protease [Rubrivivax sp. A210]CAD5372283.1 Serine protease precursor MucD/AlgY associated with sigma factor RpoE [Rubrivivax sp. A210]
MPMTAPARLRPALHRTAQGLLMLAMAVAWALARAAAPQAPARTTEPSAAEAAASAPAGGAPTGTGQRIYERTRPQLLQVRTLLRTQDSQSSVGSGFLVDEAGHLLTNYHVVSQYALQPGRHRLVYATVDGKQGALQLLAFDVVHDLALLRAADPAPLAGRGAVALRPADEPLPRGARIYALGNPLDVGFAVAEGSYNGPVERSFLPTLFFGGSLSAGMSGGPALDEQGRLVGVNVAARRDGEQVSFLVPVDPVRSLIARGRGATPIAAPAWPEITRQLLAHEAELTRRFTGEPWRGAGHARYAIPVPQETTMRCWGRGSPQAARGLQFERSDCEMDSRIFVSGALLTGYLTVRHEAYDGSRIGMLRFAERYSASFRNEFIGNDDRLRTAPRCSERSIAAQPGALPLRAVVCLRAYKKLEGLHDLTVLVATLDAPTTGVQGRFDALGVSLASAEHLTRHYLDGYAWTAAAKNASR